MKILLVHKFFYLTGGAEVFFFETGRVLEEQGHKVAYFSTAAPQNRPSPFSPYFINPPDFKQRNFFKRMTAISDIIYSRTAKINFSKLLDDFKPDIVHVFALFTHLSPSLLDVCRERNIPVVMSCNDYKHICPNYKLYHHGKLCEDCKGGKYYKSILNKCCQDSISYSIASCLESTAHHYMNILKKNVHTFLFAGEFMANKTEEFWGKGSFQWAKLLNPFDSSKYVASHEYSDYFLFFGRVIEEKGVDVLLSAMKQVPDTRLVLVGDGPQLVQMKELAHNLSLRNVEFVGPKWGDELDQLLKFTRFVVVPSIWHENFPYVIVQSFALGKTVIGTDRGGIPELINDGENGYIYPAVDPLALAERINLLWQNPQMAVNMGQKAKLLADKVFNDNVFYESLMGIYQGVLK